MSIFHQANNVFPNGLTVTNGITTDSLVVNGVSITSGGGGGGSTPLSTKVPTTIQQTAAETAGTGLATYYDNDTSKAAATNVTYSIMSEVDAINGEVVALEATATTLQGQVAELDNVVGVLTGLTLGTGAFSTGTAALSAISAATSTNAALQKSALLHNPTSLAGITNTSTTTTYDANTIQTIATNLNTLNTSVTNLAIPSIVDNSSFTNTITSITKTTNNPIVFTFTSMTNIVVGTQITLPYLTNPFAMFVSTTIYVISINSGNVNVSYSPNGPAIITTASYSVPPYQTTSIPITCINVYSSSSKTSAASANSLTNVQNYLQNAVTSPYIAYNATNLAANATSAVSVGNSAQTLNLIGSTVSINGTAYSAGGGSVVVQFRLQLQQLLERFN